MSKQISMEEYERLRNQNKFITRTVFTQGPPQHQQYPPQYSYPPPGKK